ncbi:MAG: toll/interleukin-1 receptor domain-containing protein, partial [Burkholderiales bacterium]
MAPRLIPPAKRQPGPFISYSRKDQAVVRRISGALHARGRDPWVDLEDILPTAEWIREIHAGIDAAPAVIIVISPDSVASSMCAQEIDYALAQNKRTIPLVVREVDPERVIPSLRKLNWIHLLTDGALEETVERIIAAIDTDLEWVRAHTRLLVRAGEWDGSGQDSSHLLRGSDLQEYEQWLVKIGSAQSPRPTALQAQYVLASGRAQSRRKRYMLAGVSAAFVVTAALAIYAFVESQIAQQQRNTALSRLLAAQSLKNSFEANGRRDLALLQSVAARQIATTAEAQESLWWALHATDRAKKFVYTDETLLGVAIDPSGKTIATGGFKGTVALWDAQSLALKASVAGSIGSVSAAAFSPDGKTLATAGVGGITLRDAQTAQVQSVIDGYRGGATRLVWHPDGKTIFFAGINDGALFVADLSNPKQPIALQVHQRGIRDIAISPDGSTIAIAADGERRVKLWDV